MSPRGFISKSVQASVESVILANLRFTLRELLIDLASRPIATRLSHPKSASAENSGTGT
jgi:hypothetical protein